MPSSLAERLRKAGIRHYDELIHDQKKDWLLKNFKAEGAGPAYPINVARLTRNLVWQMKERVAAGPKFNLKRSFYLAEVEARHYKNQKYLVEDLPSGKKKLYGLEAEAIATARITEKLKEVMLPVIGGNEEALKIYEMKNLNQAIKDLIIFKLTHPDTEATHGR